MAAGGEGDAAPVGARAGGGSRRRRVCRRHWRRRRWACRCGELATPRDGHAAPTGWEGAVRSAAAVGEESVLGMRRCCRAIRSRDLHVDNDTAGDERQNMHLRGGDKAGFRVHGAGVVAGDKGGETNAEAKLVERREPLTPLSVKVASTTGPIMWPGRSGGGV